MERSEYPNMLARLQPAQAVDVLNDRVKHIGKLHNAVAEWIKERRLLEEQYAAGLRKLARNSLDGSDLGVFSVPWNTITDSLDTLADSHSAFAAKFETELERPLREFTSGSREMNAVTSVQGNLGALAKDVDRAQQKTEKLQGKATNKQADASSDLDHAQVQWQSQAPYVFEQLQVLDEARLAQLRDLFTQSQTIEMDQVEKQRATTEHCLNILLNVETQDEIATFAIKSTANVPRATQSRSSNRASFAVPSLSIGRSNQGPSATDLAPIPSNAEASSSQRDASINEKEKKGPLKGLKRLGTVMGRRSSKVPAGALPSMAETPERKSKSSRFGLGRSKSSYLSDQEPESSTSRPPLPHVGSEILDEEPEPARAATRTDDRSLYNGTSTSTAQAPVINTYNDIPSLSTSEVNHLDDSQISASSAPTIPQKDNEGFSVPPPVLDPISEASLALTGEVPQPQYNVNILSTPIKEEGGAAALENVAGKLQAPPTSQRRMGTVRGRRDARNSAVISTYGAPGEEQGTAEPAIMTAPDNSQSIFTARTPAEEAFSPPATFPTSSSSAPSNAIPAIQQTFPSPVASTTSAFAPMVPVSAIPPAAKAILGPDYANDTQSIRSGRSLASTGSQGIKHAELNEAGLNSSLVETVSARFEHGKLLSSSLIGEIALAYNATDFSSPFGHETIRLDNFSILDKVAPNPAFLSPTASGREGEYSVKLAGILKTQIAFKYQLRYDDTHAQVPILVTPAFRIEPTQTSVIVSYSLQPGFALHGRTSIKLSNVTLALTLEGAAATSCMSKPVGIFSRERNTIFWQIADIVLEPGQVPQKLLARFTTEGQQATGGSVDVKWDLVGENARGLGSSLGVSAQAAPAAAADSSDPFADEDAAAGWKRVPTVAKLSSGLYVAK